jgi:hypothetical protein
LRGQDAALHLAVIDDKNPARSVVRACADARMRLMVQNGPCWLLLRTRLDRGDLTTREAAMAAGIKPSETIAA